MDEPVTIVPKENDISIAPNPATGLVRITSVSNEIITEYTIYDINGSKISQISGNESSVSFDLSNYDAGTYLITVKTATNIVTKKIVKY